MKSTGIVTKAMIEYFAGDVRRINHFLKVYAFAKTIGELEELDESTQEILEIAAITHDIGIKNSEKKYNSSSGHYQQIEGPSEAEKLLGAIQIKETVIERVCWLIAHHHIYTHINEIDYQILVEADFLVNASEDQMSESAISHFKKEIFRTETGKLLLDELYAKAEQQKL